MLDIKNPNMSKAQLAKMLNVSRTYITLLTQGKRQPSREFVDKLRQLGVDASYTSSVDDMDSDSGLQIRWGALSVPGGFDTHPPPPYAAQGLQTSPNALVTDFLKSRRSGLSPRSIEFYRSYLNLAIKVVGTTITGREISAFLNSLLCTNG